MRPMCQYRADLCKQQIWHMDPNGALATDSRLARHALRNVIGRPRQRLLRASKGVEPSQRVPEERRGLRWEWKLNSF